MKQYRVTFENIGANGGVRIKPWVIVEAMTVNEAMQIAQTNKNFERLGWVKSACLYRKRKNEKNYILTKIA